MGATLVMGRHVFKIEVLWSGIYTPKKMYAWVYAYTYTYTFYTQNNGCFCIYFDQTPILGVLGCIIRLQYT